MKIICMFLLLTCCSLPGFAQQEKIPVDKTIVPVVGSLAVGCVTNPFSFTAGIQQSLKQHLRISYDIHFWNTRYEDYLDNIYSKGHFIATTPSVKLLFNTGKRTGSGLVLGLGLGYMIAHDRGTEQAYAFDSTTNTRIIDKALRQANWDFNSIAPSVTFGYGFRLLRFPVTINNVYYFGKDTKGWAALAGGMGITFGLKRD